MLALLLGALASPASAEDPYVVGGDDDPNKRSSTKGDGPALLPLSLLRVHRYDERYATTSVAVSPDGLEVAAVGRLSQQGPRAWSVSDGRRRRLPPVDQPVRELAYDFEMTRLAIFLPEDLLEGSPAEVRILDLKTGRAIQSLEGAEQAEDLAFSPDGKVLVAATPGGVIAWNLGQQRAEALELTRDPAESVTFAEANTLLITGEGGGLLQRYSFGEGRLTETLEGKGARSSCYSPDGRFAALATNQGLRIVALDGEGGRQLIPHPVEIVSVDWASAGNLLVAGTSEGEVLVFVVDGVGPARQGGETRTPASATRAAPPEDRSDARNGREGKTGSRGGPPGPEPTQKEERPEIRASFSVLILDQFTGDPREGSDMERRLGENVGTLEGCWNKAQRREQNVVGSLRVAMDVTADGEGRSFDEVLDDGIGNPELRSCLEDKLRSSVFPPGLGTLEVELTIQLAEVASP